MDELVVDNFAGGGGASTGIRMALGREVDVAINHDEIALAIHKANHPNTQHLCEDVWDVDPRDVAKGRPVGLCWLSPDCTHFSKAKGGKPVKKEIRGLAWVAVRWAATVRPRVIILENVEEFKTWGPLLETGRPDPKKKGRTFKAFIHALERQGYKVEWRELRACDYGAPTVRKRLFMIARCDGQPIVWPSPTHGDPSSLEVDANVLKPWRTAAEIIDWSLPCPSIFERKRPLAEATLRRIARGIMRFVVESPDPFIIKVNHSGDGYRGQAMNKPLQTVTAKNGWGIVAAFLSKYHGEKGAEVRGQILQQPLFTQDTSNRFGLVTSHLVKFRGTNIGQPTNKPLQTVTAGGFHFGEVRAFLIKYFGTGIGQDCREPLHTVTTKDRFGLVAVEGQDYQIVDIGMRMLQPRELFNAQGFPPDYFIDRGVDGKPLSKAAQVAKCGNAVPPQFAEALVKANLGRTLEASLGKASDWD